MHFLRSLKSKNSFQYHSREVGMCQVSVIEDKLPFKIVLMNPDTSVCPHAYIYALGTTGKEIGAFEITDILPRTINELKPYAKGHKGLKNVSIEWQEMIVAWASKRSKLDTFRSNWQFMQHLFYVNAYAGKHNV